MKVRPEPTTRYERDDAARRTLLAIADLAKRAEHTLWEAGQYERGERWGTSDCRQTAEEMIAEMRLAVARLQTEYGDPPVRVLSVVGADAATDAPTDAEIDEAAAYEASQKFAADISASAYQHLLRLMRRGVKGPAA